MGMAEELGELAHAHLKELQGIRGTAAEHEAAARDAIGDLLVYAMSYANARGWDLEATLGEVWSEVRRRDWVADPQNGDAMAGEGGAYREGLGG